MLIARPIQLKWKIAANLSLINAGKNAITSYRTTKAGDRFERQELVFTDKAATVSGATLVSLEIDSTKKYRSIFGFGEAFTDATEHNLVKLPLELH